ncbi:MAG: bifunctional 2-C-methyl-D-erythritol 4-phosphate cytidylyltransferase/2-C-methyl-D-erythritol 2,4-cyclodiphosphate synthase [Campylobacterota bacterium]|nr:bifunctional 2-C-methyl-D-erythritol 4-phosphate cytidylyltransferase/2-C-methyl-D-erythritol 2,4-cyclodiphosphate synthase [Campylobacterota bacterium]
MIDTTLVLLSAGNSSRFELNTKKQWLRIGDEPLWLNVTNRISSYASFDKIIVVAKDDELNYMKNFSDDIVFVAGGDTRQNSMKNALLQVTSKFVMVTDVARCCVPKKVIQDLLENRTKASCIVPILNISDTVIYNKNTINRDEVKLIQTPQLSDTAILKVALNTNIQYTDDSSAIKNIDETIHYIQGSLKSKKLTFGDEIDDIDCLKKPSNDFFVGQGLDIHQFISNKQMVLGGVKIDSDVGFKAHSDGDVLIHSVIDALLGACGAGDIGEFFPDTDSKYKNADSKKLLEQIVTFVRNVGYDIVNIDITILAQKPKINPYKNDIKSKMTSLLNIPKQKINIKATTAEKMGFVGRKEGVTVHSIANLKYYDWTKK